MHVLAATGDHVDVSAPAARSWPLAGTQMATEYTQGWMSLKMGSLATGEGRYLPLRRIYRSNPWVFASVNMVANGLASFPLRVTDWGANGQRIPVRGDIPQSRPGPPSAGQVLDRRLNHPAPRQSRRRAVRRVIVDKMVYGNGLWAKEPDGYGGIAALWNCPWRSVSVITGTDQPIDGYRVMDAGGMKVWAPEDVVLFGEGDADGPIAPSPLESLQYTIALNDALYRHLVSFFQNQARPSGVLKLDTMPEEKELRLMREQIKQLYSGPENAGEPLITSGTWSAMNGGVNYADLVELAKLSRDEVAAAYNIPPPVLGIMDRAIKSNVAELREQFLRDVLAPFGAEMTDEIVAQIIDPAPQWSGLGCGFDMSDRLLPDLESLATTFKELKRVLTVNELRRMMRYPDLEFEGADMPWMEPGSLPANMAPQGATVSPDGTVTVEPVTDPPAPNAEDDEDDED